MLRLGKSVEVLYGTLKTLHIPDASLRSLLTLSRIAQSLFLLVDHIIWFGRVGLFKIDTEKWSRLANRCWLYSIVLNLLRFYPFFKYFSSALICPKLFLRDVYEIKLSWRQDSIATRPAQGERACFGALSDYCQALFPQIFYLKSYCLDHKDVAVDTAKNLCDIFIPLSNQGHVTLNPGIIGALGVLSSIAGIIALIDPLAKLTPS